MRDRLHFAWPQIITVTKIMDKMLLPQKYQIPARPLHSQTRRKPVPHSQRLRTMHLVATIIRDLVIRRVCAETPVPSL